METKISDIGIDVRSAADKQLSSHSDFNALPIFLSDVYDLDIGNFPAPVVGTHNLGYAPIFHSQIILPSESRSFYAPSGEGVDLGIGVSSSYVYNLSTNYTPASPIPKCHYQVLRRPLDVPLNPLNVQLTPSAVSATSSNAGTDISKTGTDVRNATDKEKNFKSIQPLNLQAHNLLIHSINTGSFSGASFPVTLTINHNLGYLPIVWWYLCLPDYWVTGTDVWEMISEKVEISTFGAWDITSTENKTSIDIDLVFVDPDEVKYSCVIFKNGGLAI